MLLPEQTWRGAAHAGILTTHGGAGATITVSAQRLVIESKLGRFVFEPSTVTHLERAGLVPWFWCGIRLHHRVPEYPDRIGFAPKGISSGKLLELLRDYGYPVVSKS